MVWLFSLWIAATRGERIGEALRSSWPDQLAVASLLLALLLVWAWSWRDVVRSEATRRVGVSQWDLAVRAFSRNRTAVVGLMAIVAFYLIALLTPLISPFDPAVQGDLITQRLAGPSALHPLGTDKFARDVYSRLLYGARISLTIGFVAVGISVTIGTLLGAVAGYVGGWLDSIIMRFVDHGDLVSASRSPDHPHRPLRALDLPHHRRAGSDALARHC